MYLTQIKSISEQNTIDLAAKIGAQLKGGEIIELVSDVGGGKTTFIKGLAKGVGYEDLVRSPSFTIENVYKANDLTIHHFDFYRLSDAGIMRDELAEVLLDSKAVVVIEWGALIKKVLPKQRLVINIKVINENSREFRLNYPNRLEYLMTDLTR